MKRQDLLTQEEFIPKRINQKFSCSQNRIKFYNNKANEFRHSIAYISKPLNNNIKIIIELMKGIKECVFHREFLLGKGFSFDYCTHIEQYNGKNHYAVHNYILSISNDEIKIIKYR